MILPVSPHGLHHHSGTSLVMIVPLSHYITSTFDKTRNALTIGNEPYCVSKLRACETSSSGNETYLARGIVLCSSPVTSRCPEPASFVPFHVRQRLQPGRHCCVRGVVSYQFANSKCESCIYIYILAFFKVSLMMVFDRFNNGGYEWGTDVPVNLYIYHQWLVECLGWWFII